MLMVLPLAEASRRLPVPPMVVPVRGGILTVDWMILELCVGNVYFALYGTVSDTAEWNKKWDDMARDSISEIRKLQASAVLLQGVVPSLPPIPAGLFGRLGTFDFSRLGQPSIALQLLD